MVAIVSIPTVYLRHSKNDQPQFVFEEVLAGENIKRTRVSNCQAKRQRLLRDRMVPCLSGVGLHYRPTRPWGMHSGTLTARLSSDIKGVGLNRFAVSGKSIFGDLALTNRFGTASRVGSMCGIA